MEKVGTVGTGWNKIGFLGFESELRMEILETALHWYKKGIAVIPIQFRDKKPDSSLLPRDEKGRPVWEPFQKRLPTEDELKTWFPSRLRNMAIITGWRGLVVLDFDNAAAYSQWRMWTTRKGGFTRYAAESTFQVRTARGIHVYIRLPHTELNRKLDGIDIKAAGGYVLAPPSIHPTGIQYQAVDEKAQIVLVDALSDILPAKLLEKHTELPEDVVTLPGRAHVPQPSDDLWETVNHGPDPERALVDQIREKFDILSFFPNAEKTSSNGRWYRSMCPFHQDNHPSFWIDRARQICGCFATCTPKPLDVINLYARLNGISNVESIFSLSRLL